MKIDLSLHPQRKTVFKGFTFHFLDPSSPYTEIVPLAGGQIDRTSLTYASQASSPLASHIVVFPSEESPELSSEASVTLKRPLSEAAAAWARRGWLPLAEQELMRALVFDGEMQRLVAGARRRWEEEMRERESVGLASDDSVETVESQSSDDSVETVESQSSVQQLSVKQSLMQRSSLLLQSSTLQPPTLQQSSTLQPPIQQSSTLQPPTLQQSSTLQPPTLQQPSTLQPPIQQQSSTLQPPTLQQSPIKTTSHLPLPATLRGLKRPQQTDDGDDVEAFFREVDNGEAKRVREKERTSCSARVESESAESEPFLSDELESEHEEKVQNEVAEIRVEETTSGKGKRFKKKAFKKATGLVPLHPYQGSLVS